MGKILENIVARTTSGEKLLAVLVDPDKTTAPEQFSALVAAATEANVAFFFVGGSLMASTHLDSCIEQLKKRSGLPVVLFPGSPLQVSKAADAVLFLSLISGRNAEALIGYHVMAAPTVKAAALEVIPTGYMLVDCGSPTTASYISNSSPIPHNKPEVAACTALAGEYLGLRTIYMDGGSGADKTVDPAMVTAIKQQLSVPLIAGGGIRTAAQATALLLAGADVVVIGNVTESDPTAIITIGKAVAKACK